MRFLEVPLIMNEKSIRKIIVVSFFAFFCIMHLQAQQDDREEMRKNVLRAQTAYKAGEFEDALNEYKKALNFAPQYPELYKAIGDVYEKIGGTTNLSQAIIHYQRYIELAPNAEDNRSIQDKIYALQYLQEKSQKQDEILDDLSGAWVAMDNIQIIKTDVKTGAVTYMADFIFKITEIQKTGKYRITIQREGSRYYRETIIDKTVNIVPQKDHSFNFTIADAQTYTPNAGIYSAARLGARMLGTVTEMDWLGDAANVAIDIRQTKDLPSNTQTAYIFALKYKDGKLEGLVNVVRKFADQTQQKTLENGLYEITFVKQNNNLIKEINESLDNKHDGLHTKIDEKGRESSRQFDKYGVKLSRKEITNKITNFDYQLGNRYRRASNQEIAGMTIAFGAMGMMFAGMPLFLVGLIQENDQLLIPSYVLLGAGGGISLFVGIPIGLSGNKKVEKIKDEYNDRITSQPRDRAKSQLYFGISPAGSVGLTLKF